MKGKVLYWTAFAFVVFFVTNNPAGAARAVKSVIGTLTGVATGVGAFLTAVTS